MARFSLESRPVPLNELLHELRSLLGGHPEVQQAYLFGSYARGQADELSDLDLIIVADTDKRFVQRAADFDDLYDIGLALEIMVYTPEEFETMRDEERPFLMTALEEAIPIL